MKTILVDAWNTLVTENGFYYEMQWLLDIFPNKKIILTNANDEQMIQFGIVNMPYDVFTLKHNPDKINPEYYKKMLENFNLTVDDVVYFEHNIDAVNSAKSLGINVFHYDKDKRDLKELEKFLKENLCINKDKIKEMIYIAFNNVSYPKNITLRVGNAHDDYDYENDNEYKLKDYYGDWQNVPEEDLINYPGASTYLEPDGIRYYLPRYMIWTLDNYDAGRNHDFILDIPIYRLCLDTNINDHNERFKLFNEQQNVACSYFLLYFLINDPTGYFVDIFIAKKGFEKKWKQFISKQI